MIATRCWTLMYENRRDSTCAVQRQTVRRYLQCGYGTDVTKRIISLQLEPGTHWTIYVNLHEKWAKYFDPAAIKEEEKESAYEKEEKDTVWWR